MRFITVLQSIAALLFISVSTALYAQNANQTAAEKIADLIGERFDVGGVTVSYLHGEVTLGGDVPSQEIRRRIEETVSKMENVTKLENNIKVVAPRRLARTPATAADRMTVGDERAKPPAAATIAPIPIPPAPPEMVMPVPRVPARFSDRQIQPTNAEQPAVSLYSGQYVPPPAYNYNAPNAAMPAGAYVPPAQTAAGSFARPMPSYVPAVPPAYYPSGALPGGVLPGQYNQPTLPEHAWPAYAAYPNYAQVSYPRVYSPKAWPYIGPFYPYPQVPLGWRKVTLENHDGWWWLDFDDGAQTGPFSPLFRQPQRYTY